MGTVCYECREGWPRIVMMAGETVCCLIRQFVMAGSYSAFYLVAKSRAGVLWMRCGPITIRRWRDAGAHVVISCFFLFSMILK